MSEIVESQRFNLAETEGGDDDVLVVERVKRSDGSSTVDLWTILGTDELYVSNAMALYNAECEHYPDEAGRGGLLHVKARNLSWRRAIELIQYIGLTCTAVESEDRDEFNDRVMKFVSQLSDRQVIHAATIRAQSIP